MVTAVCFLFLLKLKWPKNKNIYDVSHLTGGGKMSDPVSEVEIMQIREREWSTIENARKTHTMKRQVTVLISEVEMHKRKNGLRLMVSFLSSCQLICAGRKLISEAGIQKEN